MDVLGQLEHTLGLSPVNFDICSKVDFSSTFEFSEKDYMRDSMCVNENKKKETSKKPKYDYLDITKFDTAQIASDWDIPENNVMTLLRQLNSILNSNYDSNIIRMTTEILKGIYYDELTRDDVNRMIHQINGR